jgi:hypothetical protein
LPAHGDVERLRAAIHGKNELFFHRWRAHNAEYIFGRRAKPYGVVSFPPEMQVFDRLIQEADRKVWGLSGPGPSRDWQLAPAAP